MLFSSYKSRINSTQYPLNRRIIKRVIAKTTAKSRVVAHGNMSEEKQRVILTSLAAAVQQESLLASTAAIGSKTKQTFDKSSTSGSSSIRLELGLFEPNADSFPEFNFLQLLNAEKVRPNIIHTAQNNRLQEENGKIIANFISLSFVDFSAFCFRCWV